MEYNTKNILLTIAYDGRNYHGWQIQQNGDTVQARLQSALAAVFGTAPAIKGCSRTDAGVHARMFCVSMTIKSALPNERIVAALNAHLPRTIAVLSCREVREGFHARYSSLGKRYSYEIWNSPVRNPFLDGRATHIPWRIDENAMQSEGRALLGRHDFAAFCAAGSSVADTVRTVSELCVIRDGDMVRLTISADGFLYNMVRIIAGTLLDIERGKLPRGSIGDILESRDRSRAGRTAPPDGLYLDEVFYDKSDFLPFEEKAKN